MKYMISSFIFLLLMSPIYVNATEFKLGINISWGLSQQSVLEIRHMEPLAVAAYNMKNSNSKIETELVPITQLRPRSAMDTDPPPQYSVSYFMPDSAFNMDAFCYLNGKSQVKIIPSVISPSLVFQHEIKGGNAPFTLEVYNFQNDCLTEIMFVSMYDARNCKGDVLYTDFIDAMEQMTAKLGVEPKRVEEFWADGIEGGQYKNHRDLAFTSGLLEMAAFWEIADTEVVTYVIPRNKNSDKGMTQVLVVTVYKSKY